MNNNIQQLYHIAAKSERLIVGLMSGTSLDGLDIALCRISDSGINTKAEILQFETVGYSSFFKQEVKSVFSQQNISLEKLCLLNAFIGSQHAQMINQSLANWNVKNESVDLIASHGQTVYHAPKSLHQLSEYDNATLQIGDADHIATKTGIITISDFRQKHIAVGGEGAPLALYGDYLLFTSPNENRVMLNIGGIANFTFLPASGNANKIICTDTGPGNTIMDAFVCKNFSPLTFDINGAIAKQGVVSYELFNTLKQSSFFDKSFPKTTGPELFNLDFLQAAINQISITVSNYDILATLNWFTAATIADALNKTIPNLTATIYVSGGGKHNELLMQNLKTLLPQFVVKNTDDLNVNADAKEALLFAVLANECVAGNGFAFAELPNVNFGKISFPC